MKFFRMPNKYQNAPLKPKCNYKSDLNGLKNSKLFFKTGVEAFSEGRHVIEVEKKGLRYFMKLVADVAAILPDGLIVTVHSPELLFEIPILDSFKRIGAEKLPFFEGENREETVLALDGFVAACDAGRGGVFFCTQKRGIMNDAYLKPTHRYFNFEMLKKNGKINKNYLKNFIKKINLFFPIF